MKPMQKLRRMFALGADPRHQNSSPTECENLYNAGASVLNAMVTMLKNDSSSDSSFKCGCLAKILASVDKLSSRVFVKIISAEHNHETSQALYKHYPKQRLLNKSEESGLKSLCKLKVSSKMLRHHVKQNIGKNLCLKDISNIKSRVRASDKSQSGVNWNDAQLLLTRVKEMKMMDTGATVDIGVKEDGTLKHLFYQSSDMKAKFNSFPEHILVDATYCVNDRQMPLVTFMCVDGNLESNVVALALVCEESKDMLSLIYRTLRLHNPCTERLNTFMVDKDLNEISCLQTAFPNAIIELCLFHVQKAMKKKINELSCGKIVKDVLRECCAKVCYARSECEYEECKKKLLECDIEFASYFIEHWDSMRDKWVQFERNKHLNFNNRTNNRLESFHQKLKSEVPRNAPLDIMFENILLVLESLKNEISHRQFQAAMKQKPCSRYAYLQNQLTPFAFSHTISELDKMTSLICEVRNDCVVVQDDGERIVQNDTCDCRIFSTFCLPCRHIMASYKIRDMPPLHIGLFSERWMRRNQEVPAHLPGVVHRSLNDNPARRPWTKARKYMEAKVLALKIADKMSEIGMHSFFSYVKELNKLDTKLSFQRLADSGVELNEDTERLEDLSCVDISSVGVDVEPANSGVIDEENVRGRGSVSVLRIEEDTGFEREIVVNCENVNRMDRDDTNNVVVNCDIVNELHESSDGENDTNIILSEEMSGGYSAEYATENNVNNEADNLDGQNVELDNTSGNNVQEGSDAVDYDVLFFREIIANVKPPLGLSKRGRPKGSHLTVLGSERKRKKKNSCNGRSTFKEKVGRNNSSRSFNSVSTMPLCSSRSACIQSESFELSNVKTSTPPPLSSRFEFFKSAQEVLSSCQTFQELSIVAKSLSKSIGVFQLPDVSLRSVGQKNAVDMSAFKLLREATPDFEEPFLPVKVVGDGNCVPRSLSILCFGDQDHHQEVRCRIAIELSANPHDYLNLPKDQLNLLCQFSDCLSSTPMETFQKETLKISKNSEYMGMWQVMAATRVFKTAIRSVYPALGPETCRAFFNRTFYPLETISSLSTFTILWCATEDHEKNMPNEYWTANHVVPLVARG